MSAERNAEERYDKKTVRNGRKQRKSLHRGSAKRGQHTRRLHLERLENRRVLTVLLSADFTDASGMADAEGFTSSGPADEWHLSTGRGNQPGHSDDTSFYFGSDENAFGNGTYGANANGRLLSPPIDLINVTSAELRFNHFIQVENGFDFARVSVVDPTGTSVIATSGTTLPFTTAAFEAVTLDLTPHVGQSIQIQFEVITDSIVQLEGWYVDDVVVEAEGSFALTGLEINTSSQSVSEGGVVTGTVSLIGGAVGPRTVQLSSSDSSELSVPSSVQVLAGETVSQPFSITGVDDQDTDGDTEVLITASIDSSQAGVGLDETFGTTGIASTPLRMLLQPPRNAIERLPDGKILAASESNVTNRIQLARFNQDGTLDTTFADNGIASVTLQPNPGNVVPTTIRVQQDGRILLGGAKVSQGLPLLMRFTADGSIDTNYGMAGFARLDSLFGLRIEDMEITADGKVMAAMGVNGSTTLIAARIDAVGDLDNGFGNDGVMSYPAAFAIAQEIEIVPGGGFLLSGAAANSAALIRAFDNGTLDVSFGNNGLQAFSSAGQPANVHSLQSDSQGRIVWGLSLPGPNSNIETVVARMDSDGNPDMGFNSLGFVGIDAVAGANDIGSSTIVLPNDQIITLGFSTIGATANQLFAVRHNEDGSVDESFNDGDPFLFSGSSQFNQRTFGSVIQSDGGIITLAGWGTDFNLVKIGQGSLQTSQAITVIDNDTERLQINFDQSSVVENQRFSSATVTRTMDPLTRDFSRSMTVTLSSNDTNSIRVPPSIVIPSGRETSDPFTVEILDDFVINGTREVIVTAEDARGDLSPSYNLNFGDRGIQETFLDHNRFFNRPDIEVQPDGKILALGSIVSPTANWRLNRYLPDGSIDSQFGLNGSVTSTFPSETVVAPVSIALHDDGKISVIGVNSPGDTLITQYLSDGSVDTTFGTAGVLKAPFNTGVGRIGVSASDGGLVTLANSNSGNPVLHKLTDTGNTDPTFGVNGEALITLGSGALAFSQAVERLPNGKYMVAGKTSTPTGDPSLFVARINADGSPDSSFGSAGVMEYFPNRSGLEIAAIATQDDGRPVVVGSTNNGVIGSSDRDWLALRVLSDGSGLDPAFNGNGFQRINLTGQGGSARDLFIRDNGKIVVVGGFRTGAFENRSFAQFTPDGMLDISVGQSGIGLIPPFRPGSSDQMWSIVPRTGGGFTAFSGGQQNFYLESWNLDAIQFTGSGEIEVTDDDAIVPRVTSVTVNEGSNQRSQVTSVTVRFNTEINSALAQSAFSIQNLTTGNPVGTVNVATNNATGNAVVTLTFDGAETVSRSGVGALSNSLADGNYRLDVDASFIRRGSGVRMAADDQFGDQLTDNFFRLYGDSDGDRDVDGQDYGRFGLTFLKTADDEEFNSSFDSDGDGDVDGQDYGRFGLNFLGSL